jgi:hypothetical protein
MCKTPYIAAAVGSMSAEWLAPLEKLVFHKVPMADEGIHCPRYQNIQKNLLQGEEQEE